MTLAASIERGFFVHDRWLPWGTLFGEVLELHPDVTRMDPRWLDVQCPSFGDIATLDSCVNGPHVDRPVLRATYGLTASVADEAGLAALRETLDAELGPGQHEAVEPIPGFPASGSVRASSGWRVGDVEVSLSAFATARDERFGAVGGRLYVSGSLPRLARPFLERFEARGEPWTRSAGQIERFAVPGQPRSGELDDASASELALRRPHLHRTPAWIAETLGREEIALWSHPSGTWGIANRHTTVAIADGEPIELCHERWLPARGGGYCVLYLERTGVIAESSPGAAGLDAIVARLCERSDVSIEEAEYMDA